MLQIVLPVRILAAASLVLLVSATESLPARRNLPATAPVPETSPKAPASKPEPGDAEAEQKGKQPPDEAPIPPARPATPGDAPTLPATPDQPERPPPAGSSPAAPPAKAGLPSREELACRTRLSMLGAQFTEAKPSLQAGGCWMPFPVEVSRLTDTVDIAPPVVLNCAMAEASARFMRDVATPAAKAELGSGIKSVAQASGFVCRVRNGTAKLSEHALGNALDIAAFTLDNGQVVTVEPAPPPKDEKFLRTVRNAACGPFKTVLGPGSNADHALHLHFDLQHRKNGGTYCK